MSTSRPTGKDLADLLAHPPGDGITVRQDGHETEIKIKADISGKYRQRMILVGVPCAFLGCIIPVSIIEVALNAEQINWPLVITSVLLGLPAFFAGTTCLVLMLFAKGIRCSITLGKDECTITDRGSSVKVPWADIRGVRVLRMKKRGRQLHAKCDWPWVKGDGDGLAIETPGGSFETMGMWHHEVSEWVARLLCAHPTNSNVDLEVFEKSLIESAGHRGMPMKIDRKSIILIGVLCLPISMFFTWGFSAVIFEAWNVNQWIPKDGTVVSKEVIDNDDSLDTLRITYRYVHDSHVHTSDRYTFSGSYSAREEREKEKLAVGDTIKVWINPSEPANAVVDRGFPIYDALMSLVCAAVGVIGLGAILYGAFGKNSVLAEKYALEADMDG